MAKKPWFKFHRSAVNDLKLLRLDAEMRWLWLEMLCIANDETGFIDLRDAGAQARLGEKALRRKLDELVDAKLVDAVGDAYVVHNWTFRQKFDQTAAERMKRMRDRKRDGGVTQNTVTNTRNPLCVSVESVPLHPLEYDLGRIEEVRDSLEIDTQGQEQEDWQGYDRMIGRSLRQ